MTAVVPSRRELEASRPFPARTGPKGNLIYKVITTTDHKLIGIMYCVACFVFFALGGLMALFMRAELTVPGLQFLSNEQYNQLFTMHGTAMLCCPSRSAPLTSPSPDSTPCRSGCSSAAR